VPSTTYAPIGKMDQPVTIQYALTAADGMGGTTVTWPQAQWHLVWASVLPLTLTERERLASLQITAIQSYRIVMRYRTDLTTKERLLWRGKTLQIHTVTDDVSAKKRTVLECTEIQ
jgi:SPP1 family predicted phage head-tail adaptor